MWLPILGKRDGYGLTYGARLSFIDPLGPRTRVSIPMTWGGERRAAVELERTFDRGPVSILRGTAGLRRAENPHYLTADSRREIAIVAERTVAPWLRAGANGRLSHVDFDAADRVLHRAAGLHLAVDTRLDPTFPRNAVHATVGWERLGFETGHAGRWNTDLRGYVGLVGSTVLALRAQGSFANAALPLAEQSLLGGSDSLRGYRAGHQAGDSMAAISGEIRVPLTSPLSVGRFGVKAFADAGAAWSTRERLRTQQFDRGIGGGVYFGATAVSANVDVAWPERGKPRVHAGVGVTF
jgi:outer membrane protein assembly factor BamA